ncbi:MAG: hypothetical protein K9G60_02370 [Pseudolabrys sp.]|nr:hypothetical protein [Pseudolabrys sp.]
MKLGDVLKAFPDFFSGIVKTTSDFGPLALGILLLCVLLFLIYRFSGALGNSLLAQYAGGTLAFFFACLLGFFIYQSFEYWLRKQDNNPVMLVLGTITYQLPDDSGDLYFELQGVSNKTGGDISERFYAYDKNISEKRILAISKPDSIELRVSNRQIYRLCNEDAAKIGSRSKFNHTDYRIFLKDAYLPSVEANGGIAQYGIDFDYKSHHGSPERDLLRITQFRGIDPAKVKVRVHHEPETCLDDDKEAKFAEVVRPSTAAVPPAIIPLRNALAAFGESFISAAIGASAQTPEKTKVFNFLDGSDSSLAQKARKEVGETPETYAPLISDLLKQKGAQAGSAQINALVALKNAKPKPYRVPDAVIPDVFRLTYMGTPEVRQTARNYLTDPQIVDDKIVEIISGIYNMGKAKLKNEHPEQYLLMLITVRDVDYVAGVGKLFDYVGEWGKRTRVAGAIDESIAYFSAGIDLIKAVPAANVVPFAKPYYGMALALRSRAVVNAALKKLGPKASSQDIDKEATAQVAAGAQLPFTAEESKAFIATLDNFLAVVNGRENDYFWPAHITKIKACRAQQTYDCFRGE